MPLKVQLTLEYSDKNLKFVCIFTAQTHTLCKYKIAKSMKYIALQFVVQKLYVIRKSSEYFCGDRAFINQAKIGFTLECCLNVKRHGIET